MDDFNFLSGADMNPPISKPASTPTDVTTLLLLEILRGVTELQYILEHQHEAPAISSNPEFQSNMLDSSMFVW